MKYIIVLALVALTGCQTYDEMAPQDRASSLRAHTKKCESFGFIKGTPDMAECIRSNISENDDRVSSARAAVAAGAAAGAASRPTYVYPTYPTYRSCSHNVIGNTIYTNCY